MLFINLVSNCALHNSAKYMWVHDEIRISFRSRFRISQLLFEKPSRSRRFITFGTALCSSEFWLLLVTWRTTMKNGPRWVLSPCSFTYYISLNLCSPRWSAPPPARGGDSLYISPLRMVNSAGRWKLVALFFLEDQRPRFRRVMKTVSDGLSRRRYKWPPTVRYKVRCRCAHVKWPTGQQGSTHLCHRAKKLALLRSSTSCWRSPTTTTKRGRACAFMISACLTKV